MSGENVFDNIQGVTYHFSKEGLLEDWREEALRHREEIEKLNNLGKQLVEENEELRSQLQQKENIIKEVREWAKKYSCQFTNDDGELVVSEISFNIQARPCDLFKILDKEVN